MPEMPAVHKPRLLLIDDEPDFCEDRAAVLCGRFVVDCESDPTLAVRRALELSPDAILLDVDLGRGYSGLDILVELRRQEYPPPIIMLTGDRQISTAVEAMQRGAYSYINKPSTPAEITQVVLRALESALVVRRLRSLEHDLQGFHGEFVVKDPAMLSVMREIEKVAGTSTTVLITGESGTGKEIVARQIHALSPRKDGPFIACNCAAMSPELIESELFGHEKGAFTGSVARRQGWFEQASGGTLLLDELGDAPAAVQVKLLRVLEERAFQRVGGTSLVQTDARILAATSRNVEEQIARGSLRQDLYYRLNVYRIRIPALCERPGDIMPIALCLLEKRARNIGKRVLGISPACRHVLQAHTWPGNVRELANVIERACIRAEGEFIDLPDLGMFGTVQQAVGLPYREAKEEVLERFKREYVLTQLQAAGNNISEAARRSGLPRQSYQRMLREVGLRLEESDVG